MLVPYYDIKKLHLWGNRASIPIAFDGFDCISTCPMCGIPLTTDNLFHSVDGKEYREKLSQQDSGLGAFDLQLCKSCGWWQVSRVVNDFERTDWGFCDYRQSIVKRFDLASREAPIKALASHLSREGDDIFSIDFKKMEELVASVFREHFDCEVIHCGQTGDRGIDLLMVQCDELIPVQVKRRTKPGVTEPVSTCREMLGVMYRDGFRKAYVVSTADKHSNASQQDIQQVLKNGRADLIELIDREKFLGILRMYFNGQTASWSDVAKELVS